MKENRLLPNITVIWGILMVNWSIISLIVSDPTRWNYITLGIAGIGLTGIGARWSHSLAGRRPS